MRSDEATALALTGENAVVFRRLLAAATPAEVLQAGVELARAQLEAEISWCGVALDGELGLVAHTGVHDRRMVDHWKVPVGKGVGGRAAIGEEVLHVRDYRKDPRRIPGVKSLIDREGVRSAMVAPLRGRTTPSAAMYVGTRSPRQFSPEEASTFGDLCADVSLVWALRLDQERLAGRLAVARDSAELHKKEHSVEDSILVALHERGDLSECLQHLATHLGSSVEFAYRAPGPALHAGNVHGPVKFEISVIGTSGALADLIIRRPTELSDMERQFAARVSRFLGIHVDGRRVAAQVEQRLTSGFLQRLVDGGPGDEEDLRCQAALLGFDFSVPHLLSAIGFTSQGGQDLRPIHRFMVERIDAAFLRINPRTVVFPEAQHIAVALPAGVDGVPPPRRVIEAALAEISDHLDPEQHLVAGIGGVCQSLSDYARSHYEARLALRVIAQRPMATRVCSIMDLDVHDVVANTEHSDLLMRVTAAQLAPLLKLQADGDDSLLTTLQEYFRCGGSIGDTAKRLFVHVNTVRYRLGRVSELLGIDISEPDARFALEMAVRLQQQR